MTISPDKGFARSEGFGAAGFTALTACFLIGFLAASPAIAEEEQEQAAGSAQAVDELVLQQEIAEEEVPAEDGENARTRYLGPRNLVPAQQEPTSGKPRSIIPGPYVPAGSIAAAAAEMARAEPAAGDSGEGAGEEDGPGGTRSLLGMDAPEVDELADLDPAAIGVLEPGDGGLPADLWRGTRRSTLEVLIPQMSVRAPSPAMHKLVRQLLLSSVGVPPVGDDDDSGLSLLEARLERVAASGNLAALLEMLERVAPRHETSLIRNIRADAYLMDSDILGACDVAREARNDTNGGGDAAAVKWLKILSLCQALEGDRAGVAFNVALLQETGDVTALFDDLIGKVLNRAQGVAETDAGEQGEEAGAGEESGLLAAEPPLDALTAALYRAAGAPVPAAVLDNTPAMVLASLAGRGDLDLNFRAEAAEIAARAGIVPVADLVSAFNAMEFTEDEENSAFLLAETGLGARVDGLLYRLASSSLSDVDKTRYLRVAWRRAHREGMYPALAGVLVGPAAQIELIEDNVSAAHDVVRIALYAGERELADNWYQLARTLASQRSVEGTKALVDMWPLMVTSGVGDIPFSPQILNLWRQSLSILPVGEQRSRAALLYGLLEALGYDIENELWDDVLGAPAISGTTAPSLGVWRQLLIATEGGRLGEGLLLSIVSIGDAGPAGADPSALSSALRALISLGHEADARAIALEVLVANGF